MDRSTKGKLLDLVRRNYNDIVDSFDQSRKKRLWPRLEELTREVKEGESVIDVGCGNGRLLTGFKNKKINYLGVDFSQELIKKARLNFPGREFAEGDILDLGKIPPVGFDHVFCVAVLHHIPGFDLRVQALKQLKNKAKKEGRIVVVVWNLWSQSKFRKLILKYFFLKLFKKNNMDFGDIVFEWKGGSGEERIRRRYYHAFTKRELKKIVKKSGLKLESLQKDNYNYYLIIRKN